jgi:ABC-type taurine transport system substrate-binding protein
MLVGRVAAPSAAVFVCGLPEPSSTLAPPIEADIWRVAHKTIEMYELETGFIAAQRADALYDQGDIDGFHAWARIVNAIKELQPVIPDGMDMRH